MRYQAVCTCGWKGEKKWSFELAQAEKETHTHFKEPEGHIMSITEHPGSD